MLQSPPHPTFRRTLSWLPVIPSLRRPGLGTRTSEPAGGAAAGAAVAPPLQRGWAMAAGARRAVWAGRAERAGMAVWGGAGGRRGSGGAAGLGSRPVTERRRVPAGTRCSRGAARSCGSSVPTSSCWRCGPACPSPRTPCSSASPWSECGHGRCAPGQGREGDSASGRARRGRDGHWFNAWLLSPGVSEAQPSQGWAWQEGSACEFGPE